MPQFSPIKRQDLVRYLHMLGFDGPYTAGKHMFMRRGMLQLLFPILIAAMFREIYCPEYYARPALVAKNGNNYRLGNICRSMNISALPATVASKSSSKALAIPPAWPARVAALLRFSVRSRAWRC